VRDADDDGVVGTAPDLPGPQRSQPVFVLGLVGVRPGVADVHPRAVLAELTNHVDDPGVAHVGTVLLEREPEHQHTRVADVDAAADHELRHLLRDIDAHVVVDAPAREDHFRVVADRLRLVGEVVRIDTDAVAADEPRAERQEVPFAARREQHFLRVDAHAIEYQRQLVDQRDVDVALRVLDDLGGLGHPDARRPVGAGPHDAAVERVDELRHVRCGPGGHLPDGRDAMRLVARVDALRAVAGEEIPVEPQPRDSLEDGHADLLGAAGVDSRFVDDDVALFQHLADRFARPDERRQVGPLVIVDRRRHGDDEDAASPQVFQARREVQLLRGRQFRRVHFQRAVDAAPQLVDTVRLDVEADGPEPFAELDRERQTDVAEPDDADPEVAQIQFWHASSTCSRDVAQGCHGFPARFGLQFKIPRPRRTPAPAARSRSSRRNTAAPSRPCGRSPAGSAGPVSRSAGTGTRPARSASRRSECSCPC
jgi:hypothetical protein